ncbi:hypothetical protein, partial [Bifidobacterium ruminantium]|uniref:hypothetical protein n=1 Tax=Bifidobacterium ruminantium TaxID=78346 RepID=UPI0024919BF1
MTSEQPSLFDQLTPSDTLRDDLDWLDSLQETKPAKPSRKPNRRHPGRKHDTEPVHDDTTARSETATPPAETASPATLPDTVEPPAVSEDTTDTTPPPQPTGVEDGRTAEHPE